MRGDDGTSAGHGFQERNTKSFIEGRIDECQGFIVELAEGLIFNPLM